MPVDELATEEGWEGADRVELLALNDDVDDPLAVLGTSVTELRRKRMLAPAGTRRVTYAVRRFSLPSWAARSSPVTRPTIAHLRVAGGSRPGLTDAVTVGHLLRAALQRRFDYGRDGTRSTVFSGHDEQGPRRDRHAHAHYLALPGRDLRRIDHLFVWAPEGFGPREVDAIAALRKLRMRDAPKPFGVALVALGDSDSLSLPELAGPHAVWRSLTPMALTRHAKRRGGVVVDGAEDQIVRELMLRGYPAPEVELLPGAWMQFKTTRPGASRRRAPAVVGAGLRFAEPVHGPIALGGLSHFGLGLFTPDTDDRRAQVNIPGARLRDAQRTGVFPTLAYLEWRRSSLRRDWGTRHVAALLTGASTARDRRLRAAHAHRVQPSPCFAIARRVGVSLGSRRGCWLQVLIGALDASRSLTTR